MTAVVGGLRARFVHDSLTAVVQAGLSALGWFDAGRSHQPFKFLHGPHHWDVPVEFNAIVLTTQGTEMEWVEVGSNLTMDAMTVSIDIYAESDSLGVEVANDVRDVLRGRMPVGATRGNFPILDFRQATPSPIGSATVDSVHVQRVTDQVPEAWSRHVFTVATTINDTYY